MLYLGIDQLTIVIDYDLYVLPNANAWRHVSEELIHKVETALHLDLFAPKYHKDGIAHYSTVYGYGDLAMHIACNPDQPSSGILVFFSAHGLNDYRLAYERQYGEQINANDILQMLSAAGLEYHLSRLDVYADFIDDPIDLTQLYNDLISGSVQIVQQSGKHNTSKIKSFSTGENIETINIGARGKNARVLARFYDKKKEQMSNPYGFRRELAKVCTSWERLEVEYHSRYARQLTSDLENCKAEDLQGFVASAILAKYTFVEVTDDGKHLLAFCEKIIERKSCKDILLAYPSEGDPTLRRKYDYLISGSGLFSLFDMVRATWGEEGVKELLKLLVNDYQEHRIKKSTQAWIRKNKDKLRAFLPPFGEEPPEED
jgi:hypothetical protein